MEATIRDAITEFLRVKEKPMTRAQIAEAMPGWHVNSVNRMLRDMVRRGALVETRSGFKLAPVPQRRPVVSIREEN